MTTVLRYHPALPYYYPKHEQRRATIHPALIAAIQAPNDLVISLHRIYLTADGHKADVPAVKKFMTATTVIDGIVTPTEMNGAAVRLDPATDELAVTEGIETGLAVRLMTGMPTWAALNAAGMASLWVPETVRLVVIAADHDSHGKGQEAAHQLRDRLLKKGHQVKILLPETPGDWADALTEGASHV